MNPDAATIKNLRQAKAKYVDSAGKDVALALKSFVDLLPGTEMFKFPDGPQRLTFRLRGTIPVYYKGSKYNFPIAVFLYDTHPYYAPLCYLCPTKTMIIKESRRVDHTGRIYLPYLADWTYPKHDLCGLLEVMVCSFQEECPIFSRPQDSGGAVSTTQSQPPPSIPSDPYLPYPSSNSVFSPPHQSYTPYPSADRSSALPYPAANAQAYPVYPSGVATDMPQMNDSGTIQIQHLKASLLSAIEDKLRNRLRERFGTINAEIASVRQTGSDLRDGQKKLKSIQEDLVREQKQLDNIVALLTEKNKEIRSILATCPENSKIEIDSVIDAPAPLYRQLLQCYVRDCAIDDAIYFLGQGLTRGRISLSNYLKEIRQLSRKQFIHRATLLKCRVKANLPI